jgi:hypothetical protein
MKAAMGKKNYLALAMASLSLLLAGVLLWEWEQGSRLGRALTKIRKMPVAAVPAVKILPEFNLPDAEAGFPELLARPIFVASRRPMASVSQGVAGAMKKGQFALVGVVITPSQHSALLRDVESNKTETVAMGAQIRGLTLGEVEAGKVVLRMGAEIEELVLKVQVGAKSPPSPTPPPVRGDAPESARPAPSSSPPSPTPPQPVRGDAPGSARSAPLSSPLSAAEQELADAVRAAKIEAERRAALAKMAPDQVSAPKNFGLK